MSGRWVARTLEYADGSTMLVRERPKPGAEHITERVYPAGDKRWRGVDRAAATVVPSAATYFQPKPEPRSQSSPFSTSKRPHVSQVIITDRARRSLVETLENDYERAFFDWDAQRETGGAGFGWVEADGTVVIDFCPVSIEDSGYDRARYDTEHIDAFIRELRAESDMDIVSLWHNHPGEPSIARPSKADLRCWQSWSRAIPSSPMVGVVIGGFTKDTNWRNAIFGAFVPDGTKLPIHVEVDWTW